MATVSRKNVHVKASTVKYRVSLGKDHLVFGGPIALVLPKPCDKCKASVNLAPHLRDMIRVVRNRKSRLERCDCARGKKLRAADKRGNSGSLFTCDPVNPDSRAIGLYWAGTGNLPPNVWSEFADLAEARPEQFLKFARRNGPLFGGNSFESIENDWRTHARVASCLVSCRRSLSEGKSGEGWDILREWIGIPKEVPKKDVLKSCIETWLSKKYCFVPEAHWRGDALVIQPAAFCLFGAIGLQLAGQIARTGEVIRCYECREIYTPKRLTSAERHFCPDCRNKGADAKYRMQDMSRRRRDALEPLVRSRGLD
jgi:hypothetical protein